MDRDCKLITVWLPYKIDKLFYLWQASDSFPTVPQLGEAVWVAFRKKKDIGLVVAVKIKTVLSPSLILSPLLQKASKKPWLLPDQIVRIQKITARYNLPPGLFAKSIFPHKKYFRPSKPITDSLSDDLPSPLSLSVRSKKTLIFSPPKSSFSAITGKEALIKRLKEIKSDSTRSPHLFIFTHSYGLKAAYSFIKKEKIKIPVYSYTAKTSSIKKQEIWKTVGEFKKKIILGLQKAIWLPFLHLASISIFQENEANYLIKPTPFTYSIRYSIFLLSQEFCQSYFFDSLPSFFTYLLIRKNHCFFDKESSFHSNGCQLHISPLLPQTIRKYLSNKCHLDKKILLLFPAFFSLSVAFSPLSNKIIHCTVCKLPVLHSFQKKGWFCAICTGTLQNNDKLEKKKISLSDYLSYFPSIKPDYIFPSDLDKNSRIQQLSKKSTAIVVGDILHFRWLSHQLNSIFDACYIFFPQNWMNLNNPYAYETFFQQIHRLTQLKKDNKYMELHLVTPWKTKWLQRIQKEVQDKQPMKYYAKWLDERKKYNYPPYSHLWEMHCRHSTDSRLEKYWKILEREIEIWGVDYMGPQKCRGTVKEPYAFKIWFKFSKKNYEIKEKIIIWIKKKTIPVTVFFKRIGW